MNPERWQRIETIYNRVLELEPGRRAACIEGACAGDESLRKEVERLLARQSEAEHFIESPAVEMVAQALADHQFPLAGKNPTGRSWLQPGNTLLHFRIEEKIGEGGMGEVYRARDERLSRDVAIKSLPGIFAHDPQLAARLDREARLLASLNHPNIAAIHGLEESDGKRFIVMELVRGQTLEQRLLKGPLPVCDAVGVCCQIAEGLEAAHEKGVIHRDLKPGNVMITADDKVKVLDFGLAKALAGESQPAGPVHSPTTTEATSRPGVILGTAAYMSPEQARGKPVDKRADIWAFGCILYECLTGKRAFPAETITESIAKILGSDPDWALLPAETPPSVRATLRQCLHKDPARRLHDVADARIPLQGVLSEDGEAPAAVAAATVRWRVLPWILAAVMALIAAVAVRQNLKLPREAPPTAKRFVLPLPEPMPWAATYTPLAISPDGTRIAWVSGARTGRHLYYRRLDDLQFHLIPGLNNPSGPFFSPDGSWIAVFDDQKLKKVPLAGGPAEELTGVIGPDAGGGVWNPDGTILFQIDMDRGLWRTRASASGGRPENILKPNAGNNARGLLWPQSLPESGLLLFTVFTGDIARMSEARIAVGRIGDGSAWNFLKGGTYGRYLPTGHLVYGYNGKLMAAAMDLAEQRIKGDAVQVLDGVMMNDTTGSVHFAVSRTGDLAYVPGGPIKRVDSFVLVDRKTGSRKSIEPPRGGDEMLLLDCPDVSPSGQQIAVRVGKANDDIHVYDLKDKTFRRLTLESGDKRSPVWIPPDGKRIAYTSMFSQNAGMFINTADGTGRREPIFAGEFLRYPCSFTPDGKVLAFVENNPETKWDIWTGSLEGGRQPKPFMNSWASESFPGFSPDGRWMAYQSDKSGQMQIYMIRYPDGRDERQISQDGGTEPRWGPAGKELFYRNGNQLIAAEISVNPNPQVGNRKPILTIDRDLFLGGGDRHFRSYDVMPDGQTFVFFKWPQLNPATQLVVILNWFEELKRLVPTGKK